MSSTIRYNGIDPFSGLAPTPYVGREVELVRYAEQWGQKDIFTLVGQLTGACSGSFTDLVDKTTQLANNFSQDFKLFQIYDDNNLILEKKYCRVIDINIPSNRFFRLVPFEITLEAYNESLFSGTFGVINPE